MIKFTISFGRGETSASAPTTAQGVTDLSVLSKIIHCEICDMFWIGLCQSEKCVLSFWKFFLKILFQLWQLKRLTKNSRRFACSSGIQKIYEISYCETFACQDFFEKSFWVSMLWQWRKMFPPKAKVPFISQFSMERSIESSFSKKIFWIGCWVSFLATSAHFQWCCPFLTLLFSHFFRFFRPSQLSLVWLHWFFLYHFLTFCQVSHISQFSLFSHCQPFFNESLNF